MKTQQSGFTLIELVVVIVILGLLAATALPRFIDITSDAREASVQGVAGGLRATVALARAQYVVNGSTTATTITMDGSAVIVVAESATPGSGGAPTGAVGGISVAMPDPAEFTVVNGATTTYQPTTGGSATCGATYNPVVIPHVTTVVTGC